MVPMMLQLMAFPGGYRPPLAPRPSLYTHHLAEEAKKEAQAVASVADKVLSQVMSPSQ